MSSKGMRILLLVTLLVVAAAWWSRTDRQGSAAGPKLDAVLFPGLDQAVNDVTALSVSDGEQTVTLQREGDAWKVGELAGFPARFEEVKKTLMAVAQARPLEAKTRLPDRYASLGVEDPAGEDSASHLVTISGPEGALAELIVGNRKPGRTPAHYVRVKGQEQSWLARCDLSLQVEPSSWVERELVRLTPERVREVTVAHPDGELLIVTRTSTDDTNWQVPGVPEGKQLTTPGIGRSLASALSYLDLDDVQPPGEALFPEDATVTTTFRTFDGLTLVVRSHTDDETTHAALLVSFSEDDFQEEPAPETPDEPAVAEDEAQDDPAAAEQAAARKAAEEQARQRKLDEVRAEVEKLQGRLGEWTFTISKWKAEALTKRMDDMVKDIAVAPAEEEEEEEEEEEDAGPP